VTAFRRTTEQAVPMPRPKKDLDCYKDEIENLYRTNDQTADQVIEHLAHTHGFKIG
jgi:hypothetical protein